MRAYIHAWMLDRRALLAAPPALLLASAAGAAAGGLRWDGHHLLLRVKLNDKPADALIDFNVRQTLLDRRHASMLGVDPAANGVEVEAGGRRLGPLKVAMIDLTDYANFLLRGRIGLVLGRDLFAQGPWLLDLATPSLLPSGGESVRRGRPLPLSDRFGFATIPIVINGLAAQAALSFRDLEPMRVGAGFAARAGLARPRGTGALRAMAAMSGAVGVDQLDVAGMRISDIDATLDAGDHAPDVWLQAAILRRFRIGIELAANRLWFDPA
jgi:hypothetical protein